MESPAAQESTSRPMGTSFCLVITAIMAGLAMGACILAALLMLIVARSYEGLPPGALEESSPPDTHVSLSVLSDGCAVERGEVQGTDDVRMLT